MRDYIGATIALSWLVFFFMAAYFLAKGIDIAYQREVDRCKEKGGAFTRIGCVDKNIIK